MSISTYAELQTAVSNWLHRSDLTSYTADFISVGEARIYREVRSKQQEQRTTSTLSTTSAYINLPTDFISLRSIWLDSSSRIKLEYMTPDNFFDNYSSETTGEPRHYTIIGDEVRFGKTPDSAYSVELWYYKRLTALSSSTNTLFTNNPDLFLYAALCAATPFLKDDKRVVLWESQYAQVRDQINRQEQEGRYGSSLRMIAG